MDESPVPLQPVDRMLQTVAEAGSILIVPHNDPDPDAIASAIALRYLFAQRLGLDAPVAYAGFIGRAENKAMVRYLGRPLKQLAAADYAKPHTSPWWTLSRAPAITRCHAGGCRRSSSTIMPGARRPCRQRFGMCELTSAPARPS